MPLTNRRFHAGSGRGGRRRIASVAAAAALLLSAGCTNDEPETAETMGNAEVPVLPSLDEDTRPTVAMAAAMPEPEEDSSAVAPEPDSDAPAPAPSETAADSRSRAASELPAGRIDEPASASSNGLESGTPISIYTGAYTAAQAARGARVVERDCSSCHSPREWGQGEILRGFAGRSVFELVSHIRNTMPMDSPGRLTEQQYTDVVAYLFELNAVPTGPRELTAGQETLEQYEIEYRP